MNNCLAQLMYFLSAWKAKLWEKGCLRNTKPLHTVGTQRV